jgi:hypothetical protein
MHIHGGDLVEIYIIIHGDSKVHGEKNSFTVFKVLKMQGLRQRSSEAKRPAIYLSIHGSDTIHGSDIG